MFFASFFYIEKQRRSSLFAKFFLLCGTGCAVQPQKQLPACAGDTATGRSRDRQHHTRSGSGAHVPRQRLGDSVRSPLDWLPPRALRCDNSGSPTTSCLTAETRQPPRYPHAPPPNASPCSAMSLSGLRTLNPHAHSILPQFRCNQSVIRLLSINSTFHVSLACTAFSIIAASLYLLPRQHGT